MILSITPYSNNYRQTQIKKSQPTFKGVLNDNQVDKAIKMLASVISEVKVGSNENTIVEAYQKLLQKHNLTPRSGLGLLIVPTDKVAQFKQLHPDKNIDKVLFAAVGDKYGPIETWNKAIDSILVILTK